MSWIKMIDQKSAEGKLNQLYDQLTDKFGGDQIPNILQVQSLNPKVLEAHLDLYQAIMFEESDLSRKQRELIAAVVSSINSCYY